MEVTPINEAEAVIARFFDPLRKQIDQWKKEVTPARPGNAIEASWNAVVCRWSQGTAVRLRMSRRVDLDATMFTHLNLCFKSMASTCVTVRAEVDGQIRTVIDRAAGKNSGQEAEGLLEGGRISWLEIEVEDPADTPGQVVLFWMGLFHEEHRQRMRERVRYYENGWGDLMLPLDVVVDRPLPVLGLHFDEEGLDTLREKAASETWRPVVDRLRAEARSHLDDEPWRGVGPTWNNCVVRDGRMENNTLWIDWNAMRLCAFIGLLDDDPALMRMAVNHALAAAHCDVWHPCFAFTMPGSGVDPRAFSEYRNAINVIFAWDWAGAYLTEAGRTLLAQAISMKGLPRCLQTLMRHKYVRGNNQGVFFAYGAIVCQLALAKVWPYGGELLDVAVGALDETVTNYYAEDGGTFEGVGYATGTLAQALAAYAVVARYKEVSLKAVVPPVVAQIPDYIVTMLSTQLPYGAVIKTADGGRAGACVTPAALGLLCQISDNPAIPQLLAGLNTQQVSTSYFLGDELNLMFGPDVLPKPSAEPPIFSRLSKTGMLCSCRPTPEGSVRLQLVGGPARAGHAHDDRGSFVLEAFGEEIAIDRGQMRYDDPRSNIIKEAQYHNVLIPDGPDGEFLRQVNPCPDDTIPEGEGDAVQLQCQIDATAAWGTRVDRWVRTIESETPAEFLVEDHMILAEAGTVSFHVHSLFPWEAADEGWVSRGNRAELLVIPDWEPIETWGKADFVDGLKNPAFHLMLRAPAAHQHRLKTGLRVKRKSPGV